MYGTKEERKERLNTLKKEYEVIGIQLEQLRTILNNTQFEIKLIENINLLEGQE